MARAPIEYPFETPSEKREYRLFPDEIEEDPQILFHGTAEARLESIIENGFVIGGTLPSVSFAERSSLPLRYASNSRKAAGDRGVVIAVRFGKADIPYSESTNGITHVYRFDEQPEIHGYCIVPAEYVFW